jgi:hypothetical protein
MFSLGEGSFEAVLKFGGADLQRGQEYMKCRFSLSNAGTSRQEASQDTGMPYPHIFLLLSFYWKKHPK